jgi:hypothetical protein
MKRRGLTLGIAGALVVVGVVVFLVVTANDDDANERCRTRDGVTACIALARPYSPKASGLQPDSELRITLAGRPGTPIGESPLVVHADSAGHFPGTNGGVVGISGAEKVSTVTFSGMNANGNAVAVSVPVE